MSKRIKNEKISPVKKEKTVMWVSAVMIAAVILGMLVFWWNRENEEGNYDIPEINAEVSYAGEGGSTMIQSK